MTLIQQGLLITAIGMGLVFAVIIFLWGLMALLVRLTSKKADLPEETPAPEKTDEPLVPQMQLVERQRRAAAAAAAVAMALAARSAAGSPSIPADLSGGLSPWQSVNRSRQLQNKIRRG